MITVDMEDKFKSIIKKIPLIKAGAKAILKFLKSISFPGSREYWERRYVSGGTSGAGSYGKFMKFKAEIINIFVKKNKIKSVIEFGCGDGNQLSSFNFPFYVGLDISEKAIELCKDRFKNDKTKSFFLYDSRFFVDNHHIFKAELALSLDVIYHLVEDDIFELYMEHLFSAAGKFVIIYSSNTEETPYIMDPHCKNRQFTKWVETNLSGWKLIKRIKNRFPKDSVVDFFIYKKVK